MRTLILSCLMGQLTAVANLPLPEANTADCAGELSVFAKSKELTLADRPVISEALSKARVEVSNFNFTNLWAWHHIRKYETSVWRGAVLVSVHSDPGQITYLEPFGVSPLEKAEIIKEVLVASEATNRLSARFAYVSRAVAAILKTDSVHRFEVFADPDASDYVYSVDDLKKKAGPSYQNYRTELSLFRRLNPTAKFVTFHDDPQLLRKAIDFNRRWFESHRSHADPMLAAEVKASDRILTDYFRLDLFGGAIIDGDELIAYGVGETINSDTVVFHFLKGSSGVRGINSALLDLMIIHSPPGTTYINLEEDLGYEGLRKHKRSLNPCQKVEKNVVSMARPSNAAAIHPNPSFCGSTSIR